MLRAMIAIIWYGPCLLLLLLLRPFALFPFFAKRRQFEKSNKATSFREEQLLADYAFEVSSEGEWQQVRTLVENLLAGGSKIEIVFCSPSVEKSILLFAEKYPTQVRAMRLLLLTFTPWNPYRLQKFLTAKKLILCRYDFFPELLLYGMRPQVQLMVVAATLKNKNLQGLSRLLLQILYQQFSQIITCTRADHELFHSTLAIPLSRLSIFDFRILQIQSRLEPQRRIATLKQKDFYSLWQAMHASVPPIILGNFWAHETVLFGAENPWRRTLQEKKFGLTLVPHDLTSSSLKAIAEKLRQCGQGDWPLYFIFENGLSLDELGLKATPNVWGINPASDSHQEFLNAYRKQPGPLILAVRGVLCEFYGEGHLAYVGGGFGRSIHSVLEPYLAGLQVVVGPKVNRSTEYDQVKEWSEDEIFSLIDPQDFFLLANRLLLRAHGPLTREKIFEQLQVTYAEIFKRIQH